jgi:hypothetical protein
MLPRPRTHLLILIVTVAAVLVLSGCGAFGGSSEAEPTEIPRALVPTFTPTPEGQAPAEPVVQQVAQPAQEQAAAPAAPESPAATPTPEPAPEPTATPTPEAKAAFVVSQEIVNIRQGPGTTYGIVGSVNSGTNLEIIGKNDAGDWWQVCCVNGEPGWIFGQLGSASNTESVAVAQNIPAAPAPQPAAPAAPEPQPEPPQEAAPPPQPQGDPDAGPCGGDDGCKFKLRGGPSTGGNGGGELKMQFAFVHSGRGDEAQGSYFVVLKKDGVKLPVSDQVRSIAKTKTPGQLGEYNYEYKLGRDQLPGNSVAGGYAVWVLDGNGERDSEVFNFNISDGQQGLLWIKFDQN